MPAEPMQIEIEALRARLRNAEARVEEYKCDRDRLVKALRGCFENAQSLRVVEIAGAALAPTPPPTGEGEPVFTTHKRAQEVIDRADALILTHTTPCPKCEEAEARAEELKGCESLRAEIERLRATLEFSCERAPEDCECPGCTLAAKYGGDVDRLLADRAALTDTHHSQDEDRTRPPSYYHTQHVENLHKPWYGVLEPWNSHSCKTEE